MSPTAPSRLRPLMELRGLRAGYGSLEVLHGVDLALESSTMHVVLGANGAGKSTLLKVIAGILAPAAGAVRMAGRDVAGWPPHVLARAGVCLIPEGRGVFANLTVEENLWMATYRGRTRSDIETIAYRYFPRLAERRQQRAGDMSGGEQQMLALARGLATEPALLLVDELSMGLAPIVVEELYAILADVARDGLAVLVVEQFASVVLGLADRATVLVNGVVVASGPPASVESQLKEAYFGG